LQHQFGCASAPSTPVDLLNRQACQDPAISIGADAGFRAAVFTVSGTQRLKPGFIEEHIGIRPGEPCSPARLPIPLRRTRESTDHVEGLSSSKIPLAWNSAKPISLRRRN
jgi:hypothetical protein